MSLDYNWIKHCVKLDEIGCKYSVNQYFNIKWMLSWVVVNRGSSLCTTLLLLSLTAGVISGDSESTLDRLGVRDRSTACVDISDPLQSFPRSLSDPVPYWASKVESRCCAGESVRFSGFPDCWFRLSYGLTFSDRPNKQSNHQEC